MKLEVKVTAKDIREQGARVGDIFECPCVTALRRAIQKAGFKNVEVTSGFAHATVNGKHYPYPKAPKDLQMALMGESEDTAKPITFTMNISESVLKKYEG